MLVGLVTVAAMKKGNVAARYIVSKLTTAPRTRLFRAATMGVNATAGLATTALTSFCLTDKKELEKQVVYAPLMPGQSLSADLFCGRVLEACSRDEEGELSPNMKHFAKNCQLRRDCEEKLRKKQGLGDGEAVDVPFMGVPTDESLDESVLAMKAKKYSDGDSFKGTPHNDEEVQLVFRDVIAVLPCCAVTFLFMRKVPQRFVARITPYLASLAKQGYLLDSPPQMTKHHIVIRGAKLVVDVCVSFFGGLYIGGVYQYWKGRFSLLVVESPLVAGQSTISEYVCKDTVKEYAHLQSSFAKSNHQSLRHLSALVHNCQQRQEHERKLRQEHGLAPDAPVLVPRPGVPNGITRDQVDKAWAESLLTDREMDEPTDIDKQSTSE